MRIPGRPADTAILSVFLLPCLAAASLFDCTELLKDGITFNLKALEGPRSVVYNIDHDGISSTNTTYTIDICRHLGKVKNVAKERQCPNGSRICAITRTIVGDQDVVADVFPIAGDLSNVDGGKPLNAKWERLKTSKANADVGKEGLRIELHGGFRKENDKIRPQKAIVEFVCDPKRTGLENLPKPEDGYDEAKRRRDEEVADDDGTPSLEYKGYAPGDEIDILRLNWRTKYACENYNDENKAKSGHWGFFTWFIIVAFLSIAAYLIFGSWLNYNRYGARGWDLLPHGDTIRDVPYLMKDWVRRVATTVQGPGSRGGYAAV